MEGQQRHALQVILKRSPRLAIYLALAHLLATVMIVLTGVAWLSFIALAILPLSLIWYLRQYYFSVPIRELRSLTGHHWQLWTEAALTADNLLLERSYESRFLLILYFVDRHRRRKVNLVIPWDSMAHDHYRLLRRRLRDSKIYPE